MVAIAVRATGEKVLLSLVVMGGESAAAWGEFVGDLSNRGLKRVQLAIVDGNQAPKSPQAESVARSLEEAGADLLTFLNFPKAQWRSLKTTNIVERLNNEFRRRTKTQDVFPTQSSVLVLLFGLVASGMVRMRKIGGYETMGTGVPVVENNALKALVAA